MSKGVINNNLLGVSSLRMTFAHSLTNPLECLLLLRMSQNEITLSSRHQRSYAVGWMLRAWRLQLLSAAGLGRAKPARERETVPRVRRIELFSYPWARNKLPILFPIRSFELHGMVFLRSATKPIEGLRQGWCMSINIFRSFWLAAKQWRYAADDTLAFLWTATPTTAQI